MSQPLETAYNPVLTQITTELAERKYGDLEGKEIIALAEIVVAWIGRDEANILYLLKLIASLSGIDSIVADVETIEELRDE